MKYTRVWHNMVDLNVAIALLVLQCACTGNIAFSKDCLKLFVKRQVFLVLGAYQCEVALLLLQLADFASGCSDYAHLHLPQNKFCTWLYNILYEQRYSKLVTEIDTTSYLVIFMQLVLSHFHDSPFTGSTSLNANMWKMFSK